MSFNKSLIIGLITAIIFQINLSQSMEEKTNLDEATLNELNQTFLTEQKKYNEKLDFKTLSFNYREPRPFNHQYGLNPIFLQNVVTKQKVISFPDYNDYQRAPLGIKVPIKKALYQAIWDGNLEFIETLLSMKMNLNEKIHEQTLLIHAIQRAENSLEKNEPKKKIRLKIVELMLQHGANINQQGQWNWTALETALKANFPEIQIIRLLLAYGANITEEALKTAKSNINPEKIMQILNTHTRLLNQVQSNPTEELLRLTIFFNKPYVVQLIVNNKPELVTLNHIKLARATSPASLACLTNAFRLYKFREFLIENRLPLELILPIEEIIEKNI